MVLIAASGTTKQIVKRGEAIIAQSKQYKSKNKRKGEKEKKKRKPMWTHMIRKDLGSEPDKQAATKQV